MSKNLTLKGAAFGALVALAVSAVAPASAAGLADTSFVSLSPAAGTEYSVLNGNSFDLKSNFASTVAGGGYLKFLVTDPTSEILYGSKIDRTGSAAARASAGTTVTVTLTAHGLSTGDTVTIADSDAANNGTYVITVTNANTFTYETTSATSLLDASTTVTSTPDRALIAGAALGNASVTSLAAASSIAGTSTTNGRATDGSFVVTTAVNSNANDTVIRLVNTDLTNSNSPTVTAWIDSNGNNAIDSTEYASPTRTVNFYDASAITATSVIRPATVGDSTVVADVTTSPVLNGNQIKASYNGGGTSADAAIELKAKFVRAGDATELDSASTSWNDTTKKWTVTSANFNSGSWTDTAASKNGLSTAVSTSSSTSVVGYKVAITKNVVTLTTGSYAGSTWTARAHGLRVGDTITVADTTTSNTSRWNVSAAKVLSVPTTTSFTYAVATANESAADVAETVLGTTDATDTLLSSPTYLRDTVEAGDVSVQAYLYDFTSVAAFAKSGVKASYSVGSKVVGATGISIAGVGSATVSADGTNVYKGTTTGALTVKVKNADGDYVGEGVDVVLTMTALTTAGSLTINGEKASSSSVHYAKTNASGKVVVNFVNSSALENETFSITASSQGATASKTVTWADKVYSIVDLSDSSAVATPSRNRAVAKGASYAFDLLVQDQFKAPAGDDIRLKVASATRTVFTNTFALTAGKATVVVADGGLTTSTSDVTVSLEKKSTAGTWAALSDDSGVIWGVDTSGSGADLAVVTINYYDQTDAINLNADAANYPSSTTADYSAAVSTVALTAADTRITNTSAPAVLAAAKAVVAGKVAHATTSVGKAGVLVTLTGAGLLFKSGDVWTIGSATVLSNDGTFAVEVYSAASGEKKVAISAGAATATATITFTGASTTAKKLTITPSSTTYVAGQTVVYTILLTDTNGNPINTVAPAATPASEYITVSYEGPGIISGSLPVETDADGKATVRIVTGTSDVQNAVLTVKYDQNYDGDYVDTYDQTVVSTVPVLIVEPSAVVNVVGHRVYVKFNDAKGEEVSAVIGGVRITKTATYSGYVISKLVKKVGKVAVKAYVAGDLVKASTVTVK